VQTAALTPQARRAALDALDASARDGEALDVLVIGGGVTGAGIALDAVTRGLRVGLVEAQDWSSGTSGRSSKLVHGGLRYLQMLDFHLVHEALTERDLLLKELAPHLVRPVSFLYPLEHRVWERAYVGAGVALYDVLASVAPGSRALPWHRHVNRSGMTRLFPDLRHDAAVGAIRYWDATVDDARLVTMLVRTAVSYGAHAASRTQLVGLTKHDDGAISGAVVQDLETDRQIEVRSRQVINATGVWTEETEALAETGGGLRVLASKGSHIVVPRERIRGDVGVITQTEKSVLFIIPWSRYWIIGTTDTTWSQRPVHPVATADDIGYLLDHANAVLANPLSRDDVVGSFAGLRPLLQPGTKEGTSSAKISREHTVASPTPGLTVIAGGKLTTYRVMAKDAVDFALGPSAARTPSKTDRVPLAGAEGYALVKRRARPIAETYGWTAERVDHLLHRYGSLLTEVLESIDTDPSLGRPLEGARAYLRAEIAYAASHEGVLHLEDVMIHRTRLVFEQRDRGLAAIEEIADLVSDRLGWDAGRRAGEIESYRARCEAEEAASFETGDAAAEAVRTRVADIVPLVEMGGRTATHEPDSRP
jgi:glycerol-3-phosphate dehydrogenase